MNLSKNLFTAIIAALKAGEKILEVYNSNDFEIEKKTDDSPITLADRKAHNIIVKTMEETDIPVLSEEGNLSFDNRKNWNKFWLVDPLDGTKEFINRNGDFTVNIALIEDKTPIMGVIYVPVTEELYFSDMENGAFKINNLSSGNCGSLTKKDIVSVAEPMPLPDIERKYTVVASRSHLNDETKSFIDELNRKNKDVEILSRGSSLKFCMIAEGLADIYPRFGPTSEWDTAAGQAIVLAVGGTVLKEDGSPLEYNKENLLNPYFIVKK